MAMYNFCLFCTSVRHMGHSRIRRLHLRHKQACPQGTKTTWTRADMHTVHSAVLRFFSTFPSSSLLGDVVSLSSTSPRDGSGFPSFVTSPSVSSGRSASASEISTPSASAATPASASSSASALFSRRVLVSLRVFVALAYPIVPVLFLTLGSVVVCLVPFAVVRRGQVTRLKLPVVLRLRG